MICYSDTREKSVSFKINLNRIDATKAYLKHYSNLLYLNFLAVRSENRMERIQAQKELTICERKLEYWQRRWDFSQELALRGVAKLNAQWSVESPVVTKSGSRF